MLVLVIWRTLSSLEPEISWPVPMTNHDLDKRWIAGGNIAATGKHWIRRAVDHHRPRLIQCVDHPG